MKLYKDCNEPYGIHADYYREATLQDLKQAAKEFRCVVVPMEPAEDEDTYKEMARQIYLAILKAAEAAND